MKEQPKIPDDIIKQGLQTKLQLSEQEIKKAVDKVINSLPSTVEKCIRNEPLTSDNHHKIKLTYQISIYNCVCFEHTMAVIKSLMTDYLTNNLKQYKFDLDVIYITDYVLFTRRKNIFGLYIDISYGHIDHMLV